MVTQHGLKTTTTLATMTCIIACFLFGGIACKGAAALAGIGRPDQPGLYLNLGRGLEMVDPSKHLIVGGFLTPSFELNDFNSKALIVEPGITKITAVYVMTDAERSSQQDILDQTKVFSIVPLKQKPDTGSTAWLEMYTDNFTEQQAKAMESSQNDLPGGYMCYEYAVPPPGTAPEGQYMLAFVGGIIGIKQ
ncbi:MAG: hypothetical protein WC805_03575 [Patescibacteria group bacterium]|jgi:hypothetical protein